MLTEGAKTPLVAKIILLAVFILNELLVLLVDGVVGQVHVFVVFIYFLCVGFRGETSKTFLENIYSEGLIASHAYIDSKVKLVTVNQQRIGDVFTDDTGFIYIDVVYVINDLNSSALAGIRWF